MLIYSLFYDIIPNVTKNSFYLSRRALHMKSALRNRHLDSSLILVNQEDYKIYGDVVITGQLIVINSKVTITGNLKIVKNENLNNQVFILRSEVSASLINSEADVIAQHSTIRAYLDFYCRSISGDAQLSSDGDVTIYHDSCINGIVSRGYYVGGNNHSKEIICSNSVCIWGDSISTAVHALKLHIEGDADFSNANISVGCFTSKGHVKNCYGNLGYN